MGAMWWRRLRWLALLIAISAVATCPIGWRACRSHRRMREADQLVRYLGDRVGQHFAERKTFPPTAAGPTPAIGACCEAGGTCAVAAAPWQTPGWRALGFSIDDPHRFSYSYTPSGDSAVLRAVGDADCDGTPTVIELVLKRDPKDPTKLVEIWNRQLEPEH
jgi:hypothetical protein